MSQGDTLCFYCRINKKPFIMKRNLITAFLFMAAFVSQAQSTKIGIKAGANYANQSGVNLTVNQVNYNSSEAITGYHAGLTAEVKFLKLAIQPELIYSTQGATYKNAVSEFKNELGYLSLPVLVKIYLVPGLSLDLGPQASFLLSEKNKFDYTKSNTFDFSALAGVSYNITSKLFVQARYGLGLTSMTKDAEVKNATAQLSVGYAIW